MELKRTKYESRIAKADATISVDLAELAPHVVEHIVAYGVQRMFNDATAGVTGTPDEIMAPALKRLDAFRAGEVRTRGPAMDPVEAELMRMAKLAFAQSARKAGVKIADLYKRLAGEVVARGDWDAAPGNPEAALVQLWIEKHPEQRAVAEDIVAKRNATPDAGDLV